MAQGHLNIILPLLTLLAWYAETLTLTGLSQEAALGIKAQFFKRWQVLKGVPWSAEPQCDEHQIYLKVGNMIQLGMAVI